MIDARLHRRESQGTYLDRIIYPITQYTGRIIDPINFCSLWVVGESSRAMIKVDYHRMIHMRGITYGTM